MSMLNTMRLKNEKSLVIFALILLLFRFALFNFNVTEWGDTFSFLRIADFLTRGEYPPDAKRLPVFPLFLALGMKLRLEPVFWGRIVVFVFSVGCFFLFFKLLKLLFPKLSESRLLLACYFLLFNPIFLYWSIRVLSEVVFCFFVLSTFYLYYTRKSAVFLGVVAGIAAMTRYEGFLLFPAIALGLLLSKRIKPFILYSLFFILTISPWFIRSQIIHGQLFYTPYASDPAGFLWSLRDKATFFFHLIFGSGFCLGAIPIIFGIRKLWQQRCRELLPFAVFWGLNLCLIFIWSSVARMFFTTVPFMVALMVLGLEFFLESSLRVLLPASAIFLGVYTVGAYFLRPYFVAPSKVGAAVFVLSSVVALIFAVKKKSFLPVVVGISLIVLSGLVVFKHRDVYADVYQAAQEALSLGGTTAYFDETGLSQWYFRKNGVYLNEYLEPEEQWRWLKDNKADFVFWTNAHNEGPALTIVEDAKFAERFELVAEFSNLEFASLSKVYRVRGGN